MQRITTMALKRSPNIAKQPRPAMPARQRFARCRKVPGPLDGVPPRCGENVQRSHVGLTTAAGSYSFGALGGAIAAEHSASEVKR